METAGWIDLFDEDDDGGEPCLSQQACMDDLVRDEPAGCLYCRLRDLGEDGDE